MRDGHRPLPRYHDQPTGTRRINCVERPNADRIFSTSSLSDFGSSKQGLVENHLPADEAKEFLDIAVNAGWDKVIKDAPDTGPKLRDLMIKAAAMS